MNVGSNQPGGGEFILARPVFCQSLSKLTPVSWPKQNCVRISESDLRLRRRHPRCRYECRCVPYFKERVTTEMCVVQGIVSCLGARPQCFSLVYQEVSCSPLSSTLALNLLASTRSGGEVDQYSQKSFEVSSKASFSISRMLFAFPFSYFFH